MSKIAYCSIQEAWGIDYDELHNPNTNISNEKNINEQNINDNKDDEIKELEEKIKQLELQYETLLKKRNFDQIKSKQEQILQKNNNYLEHFAPFDQTNNNQNKSNIFDLMFLVLIGIFIIYVLDNIFTIKKIKK